MSGRAGPAWLAELQAGFGQVIRTPLDRSTGTLRAATASYRDDFVREIADSAFGDAASRLAVYNRQYWFRLFTVLQASFPLTARLFGYWAFNEVATRFLLAHPPASWDLERMPDGFEGFVAEEHARDPALVEAARLDAAWRRVFAAPTVRPYRPTTADAARLFTSRLLLSPAVALVTESFPLVALRHRLASERAETPAARPPALERPAWWALVGEPGGVRHVPLEPREAELFALLDALPLGEALARVEASCSDDERRGLPERARGWLARSVQLGFFSGLAE